MIEANDDGADGGAEDDGDKEGQEYLVEAV